MIIPSPCRRAANRRAFARMSTSVTLPESTMNRGASCSVSAACAMRDQSSAPTRLLRMASHGTRASAHRRRIPISHLDISSENMAIGNPASTATLRATFVTNDDLPTPGRAATMIRLPACIPDSNASTSRNPVGTPANADSRFWIFSRSVIAWSTSSRSDVVDPLLRLVGDALGLLGSGERHLHDVAGCRDEPPQERRFGHDACVRRGGGRRRNALDELGDVQMAADLGEEVATLQLLDGGDRVDGIAAPVDVTK